MLATSDIAFVSALMRVRTRAYQAGLKTSHLVGANESIGLKTMGKFFETLPNTLMAIKEESITKTDTQNIPLQQRWDRELPKVDDEIKPAAFTLGLQDAVATEGSAAGTDGRVVFQDVFPAVSPSPSLSLAWL
jgi:hypothetical protein